MKLPKISRSTCSDTSDINVFLLKVRFIIFEESFEIPSFRDYTESYGIQNFGIFTLFIGNVLK